MTARIARPDRERRPPARQPHPEPPRSSGLLSALFYCALALVVIVVAAGTFLFIAAPVDIIRDQVIAEVRSRTGRDLTIAGKTSLAFYPSIGLSFADVALSPPPGMNGPPTLKMDGLDVTVSILPLLSRQIDVQRIVLRAPVINLETDARGRRSWEFTAAPSAVRIAQATTGTRTDLPKELQDFVKGSEQARAGSAGVLAKLASAELRIEGGTVDIRDRRVGTAERIDALDLRASYRGAGLPATLAGQALMRGAPVEFDVKVAAFERLLDGQTSKFDGVVSAPMLKIKFDGGFAPQTGAGEGNIEIDGGSGESLARLMRQPALAALPAPIKVASLVRAADNVIQLSGLRLDLDRLNASGNLSLDLSSTRPVVRGNLRVNEIDLNALSGIAERASQLPAPSVPTGGAARATPPAGIGDLIDKSTREAPPPTRVKGFLKRADWSDSPLDFGALLLADADLKITAGGVLFNQVRLGPTQGGLAVRGGVLKAAFDDVQLYEGRAKGILTLDVTQPAPALGLNLTADGIAMQPFLRDIADNERLSGRGRLTLAVTGSGATERRLMQSLEGRGDVQITNGVIVGLDVMQQVLAILQGKPSENQSGTEFSEIAGSVVISGGVARNNDLRVVAKVLRVGGAGDIDIGQRQIDYLFRPRSETFAIEVPVRAKGPWDDVRYAAAMNREKATEALKELGRQFAGQNATDVLRDLTKPGDNGEPSKAQKFLDRFLKR